MHVLNASLMEFTNLFSALAEFTTIYRSGPAHAPGATSPFWTLLLGTLLLVACVYVVLYAHYEKQWLGLSMPTSRFERLINSRLTMQRYDNVSMAGGVSSIVAATVPAVAMSSLAEGDQQQPTDTTAFDNPMFKPVAGQSSGRASGRGERFPIETIGPNVLNEPTDDDVDVGSLIEVGSMDCENLVDISLDSTETINQ